MNFKSLEPNFLTLNPFESKKNWPKHSSVHDIMAYGSTPYVGMTLKKIPSTLKVHKRHAQNVYLRLVKSLHEQYQALSASMSNRCGIYIKQIHVIRDLVTKPIQHNHNACKKLVVNWQLLEHSMLKSFSKIVRVYCDQCDCIILLQPYNKCWLAV